MIYFCGYPVIDTNDNTPPTKYKPCGKPATPGCAFCDEHGELFDKEGDRADAREETGKYLNRWLRRWTVAGLIVSLIAMFWPVHFWLHNHLELLTGFLLGTLGQSIPWMVDRWRWLRWFSWQ